jgi:hypothetical protein
MTREEQQQRGEVARRIMDEPLLKEAFASLEAKALEELVSSPSFSLFGDRKRRRLADRVRAIRELQGFLETEIALGRQAAREPLERI